MSRRLDPLTSVIILVERLDGYRQVLTTTLGAVKVGRLDLPIRHKDPTKIEWPVSVALPTRRRAMVTVGGRYVPVDVWKEHREP